jgi:methionyl aminopeptidase
MARTPVRRRPTRKTRGELESMRAAGRILARTLDLLADRIAPGVTTAELDRLAETLIRDHGAVPSFKGLYGYPATICCAPNDAVVHGIPDAKVHLGEGDILGVDCGAAIDGLHADMTRTYMVGEVSDGARRLVEKTREALYAGIEQAVEGACVEDISRAVERVVVDAGYAVVRDLTGHGIGRRFHEAPSVPNFVEPSMFPDDYGVRLRRGMTLAIEPMVAEGTARIVQDADGWTYRTADGKLSAHFEHTVAVTRGAPLILTSSAHDGACASGTRKE